MVMVAVPLGLLLCSTPRLPSLDAATTSLHWHRAGCCCLCMSLEPETAPSSLAYNHIVGVRQLRVHAHADCPLCRKLVDHPSFRYYYISHRLRIRDGQSGGADLNLVLLPFLLLITFDLSQVCGEPAPCKLGTGDRTDYPLSVTSRLMLFVIVDKETASLRPEEVGDWPRVTLP